MVGDDQQLHKSGQAQDTDDRHARLEAWTRARFPMVREIAFRWGGLIMETVDYLAFSGRNPMDKDNVYVHTGDSGMGLTHGSRFDCHGKVINGPANRDLASAERADDKRAA